MEKNSYQDDSCLSRHGYLHYIGNIEQTENKLITAMDIAIASEGLKACADHMIYLTHRSIGLGQTKAHKKYVRDMAYMKRAYYDKGRYRFGWPQ